MKVSELFEGERISKELLDERTDESTYWDSAVRFVLENWDVDIERLSIKQATWMGHIHEDMVDWRIGRKR